MPRFRQYLVASFLTSVSLLIAGGTSQAQTSNVQVVNPASSPVQSKIVNTASAPVQAKIVNTASTPVHVSGTVNIGNAAATPVQAKIVNAATAPVQTKIVNAASAPVPVTGNMNISNNAGNPVLVRVVDEGAREPFQKSIFARGGSFTVPAGKRLVIEFASANIAVVQDLKVMNVTITNKLSTSASAQIHFLVANFAGTANNVQGFGVSDRFSASQQMRVYAGPGTEVTTGFDLSTNTGTVVFSTVTISGYLETVPGAAAATATAVEAVGVETSGESQNK
jgi:hypothetical protein